MARPLWGQGLVPPMGGFSKAAPLGCGVFTVRPAWALSWGCKSPRNQAIESEANGNCARVTERGKEAGSVNRGPMDKNRIGGDAGWGERAIDRKASMAKAQAA